MSKADDKELGSLHGALAHTLAAAIRDGEPAFTKDGDPVIVDGKHVHKPVGASFLSVARQFLKDNRIESGLGNKDTSALQQAMDDMAQLPYDGEVPAEFKQ